MDQIIYELKNALGDDAVIMGEKIGERVVSYIDHNPMKAKAILRPRSTDEIAAALKICQTYAHPLVPQGGRTNLARSSFTEESDIALSLERMNAIENVDVDNRTITVQAGATLQQVQEAASQHNMFFPLDMGSRGSCTIGGNIATNAGGPRVLRYGSMRNLVLGLEAVLPDGTVISSLNRMLKNNTGYDLKQLFIGSEGTLGIVSRAVLRLWEKPQSIITVLVDVDSFAQVIQFLRYAQQHLGSVLSSFEVMKRNYFQTIIQAANIRSPLLVEPAYYVLLETMGLDRELDFEYVGKLLDQSLAEGIITYPVVAQTKAQRDELWFIRDNSEVIGNQYDPVFSFDVSLPISSMEKWLAQLEQKLAEKFENAHCFMFGHVGDGNLHLMICGDSMTPADKSLVDDLVYGLVVSFSGSVSAEHGIGLDKKPFLLLSRNEPELLLMQQLKGLLDPKNILNPGKVLG
ncbi:MAG: FAD-binding oxidoreductase [Anaerolineales bacterium]|nr:FAD-binding oxidoreductase [Anaerolineales bacterium]